MGSSYTGKTPQDSLPLGQDSLPLGQDSLPLGQDSPPLGQDSQPPGMGAHNHAAPVTQTSYIYNTMQHPPAAGAGLPSSLMH